MSKYSNHREINDAVAELIQRGWIASRGGKHWKLFSPTQDFRFIIPGSVSDHRSAKNWLSDVKAKLKERGDEPLERHKKKMLPEREPERRIVKVVPSAEPVIEKERPKETTMLRLSDTDYEHIEKLRAEDKTYAEIARIYTDLGYRVSTGAIISPQNLASFVQFRRERIRKKLLEERAQVAPMEKVVFAPGNPGVQNELLEEIMEVVSSNMKDSLKERLLQTIARDWVKKADAK